MLLVGNGTVLTLGDDRRVIHGGCVASEGGVIADVGETKELRARYPTAEWIDAKGKWIMPGFINPHHHIYSAFARGMSLSGPAPHNFLEVLQNLWWRMDKALTPEDIRYSVYVTLIDCVRNGVTCVFDHHASPFAANGSLFIIGEVAEEIGIRASLAMEVSDRDGEAVADAIIEENLAWLDACRKHPNDRLAGLFGLHASFTLSDRTLDKCAARIDARDGYHVHVAEGALDARDSMDRYHLQTLSRLDKFGILRPNTTAAHCISVTDECMDVLAGRQTPVAHNPQSNMNNAVGTARVLDMIKKGVVVGLGTDGYTSDMLESYKAAPILQRHAAGDPGVGFAETAEMLLSSNAAIAARSFARPMGRLAQGACADMVIVDYDPPTPVFGGNQIGHILFGLTGRMVETTIIGGKVVMRDREILTVDAPAVFAKAREAAAALWKRI